MLVPDLPLYCKLSIHICALILKIKWLSVKTLIFETLLIQPLSDNFTDQNISKSAVTLDSAIKSQYLSSLKIWKKVARTVCTPSAIVPDIFSEISGARSYCIFLLKSRILADFINFNTFKITVKVGLVIAWIKASKHSKIIEIEILCQNCVLTVLNLKSVFAFIRNFSALFKFLQFVTFEIKCLITTTLISAFKIEFCVKLSQLLNFKTCIAFDIPSKIIKSFPLFFKIQILHFSTILVGFNFEIATLIWPIYRS